jgi:hypothetical protein
MEVWIVQSGLGATTQNDVVEKLKQDCADDLTTSSGASDSKIL